MVSFLFIYIFFIIKVVIIAGGDIRGSQSYPPDAVFSMESLKNEVQEQYDVGIVEYVIYIILYYIILYKCLYTAIHGVVSNLIFFFFFFQSLPGHVIAKMIPETQYGPNPGCHLFFFSSFLFFFEKKLFHKIIGK